ncbi:MAG: ATP-dependent zinc metalloprotease FtsH [Phycisphaerae bacterium]|nr:ATP-dependent zinc metalloprotease FtsH [Phycisphaerae bacterium]
MSWVIIIGVGLLLMMLITEGFGDNRREISASEFWQFADNGQLVGKLIIKEDRIEGENPEKMTMLKEDEPRKFYCVYNYQAHDNFEPRLEQALAGRVPFVYETASWWKGMLPQLLFLVVVFLAIWFLLFRRLGSAASGGGFLGSFGRSRHRVTTKEHTNITFEDVAGIDEAKQDVTEIIEFLKDPGRFRRLGGRVPRGILLVGEPGCGKTLLAKAIAGEADVPFFSISGSDFVEMFVGVGASRVRDLFKQAKESSPCIIFLDEIDAVGRRRGTGFAGGGHDEREQTLNAILVEMDGFETSDQVIVIAATNRMDVLDPALTRPGRFDRQIDVPLPDLKGRYEILKIYAARVKCSMDVDLHKLARGTPMFSGADLEALVNEAAIEATIAEKDFVEQNDLEEARDKVRWGRARKSRVIDEQEKRITAYHEAGHGLVQILTSEADPLHKVSIIPRGQTGGATFSLPEKDRYLYTRNYCNALIRVALGGRLAEDLFIHDISSGAQNDILQATEIAKKMVLDWGMSDRVGPINYDNGRQQAAYWPPQGKQYSERTAELVDEEIKAIIDEAYAATRKTLEDHADNLETLAEALMRYETLSAEEVQRICDGEPLDKPTVSDLLDAEQAKGRNASGGETSGEDASANPSSNKGSADDDTPASVESSSPSEPRP